MTRDPFAPVRQTTSALRQRLQQYDRDLRNLDRDQSLRADIRGKRRNDLKRDAEREVRDLAAQARQQLEQVAREHEPTTGKVSEQSASRRALYSTRAQGMLAAGDVHGLAEQTRAALRAGDREQAQEYLAIGEKAMTAEYGASSVRQMRQAATPERDRARIAVRDAVREQLQSPQGAAMLDQYASNLLQRAGAGDPYDDPDPSFGRQVSLWAERVDEAAGQTATETLDAFAAADRAVTGAD